MTSDAVSYALGGMWDEAEEKSKWGKGQGGRDEQAAIDWRKQLIYTEYKDDYVFC